MAVVNGAAIFGAGYAPAIFYFSSMVVGINVFLGIFNLIPIPPLDGSKVLFLSFLINGIILKSFWKKYGFFILLFFLFSFSSVLLPVVFFLFRLFLGL